ncbi:cobalamin-binding protein [Aquabacterium sp.]|uniref:cobalamin-binding protein n=1 Tax=Aquabacterium sp. TaxID=1872578 RepID=UPI002CA2C33B|nr:cobalamin-binding protein [Aquabacterium sp.]HSW03246.1 cobalamin-binding protein [Aquabacterium sp.]
MKLVRWLSLLLAACSAGTTPAAPVSVRDDLGQVLTLPAPARRVVTLAPHLAELVFAVGAGERLVGVMRYSDHPPPVTQLPIVGDAFAVNLEVIATLKPELILMWSSGVNPRQQQRLQALGLPTYDSEIGTLEGLTETLRRLGRLFGTEAVAEAAAKDTEARWQALRARYAQRPPVRVFYQLWHEPLMTVNRAHLIDQAISACGGVNVFAQQPTLTPTISWEAAVAANPQVVITGVARDEPARLETWMRFSRVEAVRRRQVIALDGHLLARMTPRFVDGAQALCEAIDRARP